MIAHLCGNIDRLDESIAKEIIVLTNSWTAWANIHISIRHVDFIGQQCPRQQASQSMSSGARNLPLHCRCWKITRCLITRRLFPLSTVGV